MKRWLKRRWCAFTVHLWIVVHRPGFPWSGVYCQRCEEVRLKDRHRAGSVVVGDHRGTRTLRRKIPKATVKRWKPDA